MYNHERKMLAINFGNPDPQQLATKLVAGLSYDLEILLEKLKEK
jgi:hypothetical protein